MKGVCYSMKKVYWCESCLGCEKQDEEDFKPKYLYCSQYVPIIKHKLNYIDEIIKEWESERK